MPPLPLHYFMVGQLYLCEHSLYDILLDIQTSGRKYVQKLQ